MVEEPKTGKPEEEITGNPDGDKNTVTQELFDSAFSKGFAKASAKNDAKIEELTQKLAAIESDKKKQELLEAEKAKDYQKIALSHKQAAEASEERAVTAENRLHSVQAKTAVIGLAAELKAINPDVVYSLVKDKITVNKEGDVEFHGATSLKEGIAAYMNEQPYLIAASKTSGPESVISKTAPSALPKAGEKPTTAAEVMAQFQAKKLALEQEGK